MLHEIYPAYFPDATTFNMTGIPAILFWSNTNDAKFLSVEDNFCSLRRCLVQKE